MQTANHDYGSYEEPGNSRVAALVVGIILAIVAVGALLYVRRLTHPKIVPAPTAFTVAQATDSSFSVDAPVGWRKTTSSAGGISSTMAFSSGPASITVSSDLEGSLYGDMQQAQNAQLENMASLAGTPPPQEVPPVVKVHEMGEQAVANQYRHYVEQPMQTVDCKLGDGRMSEFTADGGTFVGAVHGYRATFLSSDDGIQVLAVCPQRNWSILQPAFLHVIESIGRGTSPQ